MPPESKQQTSDKRRVTAPRTGTRAEVDFTAPPASFRAASIAVSSLLLIALVAAIFLAVRDNAQTDGGTVALLATPSAQPSAQVSPSAAPAQVTAPAASTPAQTPQRTPERTAAPAT